MPTITLFSAHHDPHCPPLRDVDRFDNERYLIHEGNGTSDMVQHLHVSDLLPRCRCILQQLVDGVGDVLQCSQIDPLVEFVLTTG